jgi:hypothetical protein
VEGLADVVDIAGTGGDGANTVNISTGASILAAACGVFSGFWPPQIRLFCLESSQGQNFFSLK